MTAHFAAAQVEEMLRRRAGLPAGDPGRAALRARCIESSLPLARWLAARYRGRGEPLDDLHQVAALALVKAVDRYDPARRVAFASYAVPTIVGALKRHFRDNTWHVGVPRRHKDLAISIGPTHGALTHQLGRPPNLTELAALVDAPEADVAIALVVGRLRHVDSLDAGWADDGTRGPALVETVGCADAGFEATTNWNVLQPLLASMPDRDRRVVVLRFYADLTQAEIATRLGLSHMQVSRLLFRVLGWLRVQMSAGQRPGASGPVAGHVMATTSRQSGGPLAPGGDQC